MGGMMLAVPAILFGPTPFTGWARERSMGSSPEEGHLHRLSQLDQDAGGLWAGARSGGKPLAGPQPLTTHMPTDLLDDAATARPQAVLPESRLLEGEKPPCSTGQGPFFYIGGTNGASM